MSSQVSIAENVSHSNKQCKLPTKNIKKDAVGLYQVKTFRTDLIKPVIGLMPAATEKEKKYSHVIMQWSLNRIQILIFF